MAGTKVISKSTGFKPKKTVTKAPAKTLLKKSPAKGKKRQVEEDDEEVEDITTEEMEMETEPVSGGNPAMETDEWEVAEDVDVNAVEDDDDDLEGDADEEDGDEEVEEDDEPAAKKPKETSAEDKKKSRDEQKRLLKERKATKPHANIITECKKLWETIRQKKIASSVRADHMQRLMEIITGKIQEVTFKHDAARIIQCALKYGSQEQRDTIALELKGHYAQLSQSQYGRFIVSKIMNFCPKFRNDVIKEFYGKVKKVMRHRDGSMVLEEAYSQFANATQRTALMEEFYGPEFALFKSNQARSIHDLLAENPEKKPLILKHLRASLDSLLEKGKSNIGPHTLIHRALLDYLTLADSKTSLDMVELLKDHLLAILHTREGARVAQIIILLATPKDRKHIIKSFKGYVPKIAMEQHGHTVLMTVMEAVDDTVLVSKSVLGELVKSGVAATDASEVLTPTDLMRHKYASRVAHFVFSGRSSRHQPAHVVKELKEGDETRALTSKKEDANRRNEILVAMSAVYLELAEKNCAELVRSKFGAQVVLDIIRNAEGDKTSLLAAIAKLCDGTVESCSSAHASTVVKPKTTFNAAKKLASDAAKQKETEKAANAIGGGKPSAPLEDEKPDLSEHVLVNRAATFFFKSLIVGSKEEGAVEDEKVLTFSTAVAGCVAPNMAYWLNRCAEDLKRTSGTAFVLIALLEKGSKECKEIIMKAVKKEKGLVKKLKAKVEGKVKEEAEEADEGKAKKGGKRKRDAEEGEKKVGKPGIMVLLEVLEKML